MIARLLVLLALLLRAAPASAQFGGFMYGPSGPPCTYVGPGDVASASYASWWGLQAYNCATAGTKAVNIRRASDNTTTDINTLSSGLLDTATAGTFCASTTCFVTKWYDKVSTADLSQATNGNQYQLLFNCDGTLPCAQAATTNGAAYTSAATFGTAQPYSVSCEMREITNSIGNPGSCLRTPGAFFEVGLDSGSHPNIQAGTNLASASTALNTKLSFAAIFNGASSSFNWDANIVSGNAGANSVGGEAYQLGFAGSLDMQLFEAGIANTGWTTTTRDAIEANLAGRY